MVRFGQFPENGQRQMAYKIYVIELSGIKYQKATVLKWILQRQKHNFLFMSEYKLMGYVNPGH